MTEEKGLLEGKFWEEPGTFLAQALRLAKDDKEALFILLEEANPYQCFIAIAILANNPEAHHVLKQGNGTYERLKLKFNTMPQPMKDSAWKIAREAMGDGELGQGDKGPKSTANYDNLVHGRRAIAKLRKVFGASMKEGSELEKAWIVLRDAIEEKFAPREGDEPPPRPQARKKPAAKPSQKREKKSTTEVDKKKKESGKGVKALYDF